MNPFTKRKAEELGELLAGSEEFKRLDQAMKEIKERSAAQLMLQDLQHKQRRLMEKQAKGEEISQSEIEDWRRTTEIVSMNPYVRSLLAAQADMDNLLMQVNRIIAKAAGLELPEEDSDGESEERSAQAEEEASGSARSRLWVPGQ